MEDTHNFSSFSLTAYEVMGSIRYLYFCVSLAMYTLIIFANAAITGVICAERSLHDPMYLFLGNLCVNELYGSTALYPSLLKNMLSDEHDISKPFCILQSFSLTVYGSVALFNLSAMAYDRYVSICYPLRYALIMTPLKAFLFIFLTWIVSTIKVSITMSLIVWQPLCGSIINKVYCTTYSLVKLSCKDTTVNNVFGLFGLFVTVVIPALLIVYSYVKILEICVKSPRNSQKKALKTCTPHLASLINFSIGSLFEIIQSRFDTSYISPEFRIIMSLYFLMVSPIFNPVIYGMRTKKIRIALIKFSSIK